VAGICESPEAESIDQTVNHTRQTFNIKKQILVNRSFSFNTRYITGSTLR
jgi:hypothetical protein